MAASETEPAPQKKAARGRWFKVRVVLAVLVLVVGFTLYLNWRNGLPPTVYADLGSGTAFLDVPLMAFYTPTMSTSGFATAANVSFASTTSFATRFSFTWDGVSGSSLPVRFVITPSSSGFHSGNQFDVGPSNGFLFFPAGQPQPPVTRDSFSFGTVNPGAYGLFSQVWRMNYSVREMSVHDWLADDRWIEVDYSFAAVSARVGDMPAANTTRPLAADLVPIGGPLDVSYGSGYPWSYAWSIRSLAMPVGPFVHAVGRVALDAGVAGILRANLTAAFQWGPADDNAVVASGSGPANLSFQVYVDMRFGSLLVASLG